MWFLLCAYAVYIQYVYIYIYMDILPPYCEVFSTMIKTDMSAAH